MMLVSICLTQILIGLDGSHFSSMNWNTASKLARSRQLNALPRDLEETYERILARCTLRRELLQLLYWLAFSVRLLGLQELAEVFSVT